jgi:hypothetical protein
MRLKAKADKLDKADTIAIKVDSKELEETKEKLD